MFDSVDYVRGVCERNGVPISKLEKDCGFSNGYLNPKKLKKIPYDRAIVIAEYLSRFEPVTAEYIMTGKEKAPTPEGEREISDSDLKFALWGDVTDITDDDLDDVRRYAAFIKERKKRGHE